MRDNLEVSVGIVGRLEVAGHIGVVACLVLRDCAAGGFENWGFACEVAAERGVDDDLLQVEVGLDVASGVGRERSDRSAKQCRVDALGISQGCGNFSALEMGSAVMHLLGRYNGRTGKNQMLRRGGQQGSLRQSV